MSDSPIIAHESGHDFEINVFFGQLGVRIADLDETGTTCDLPHLSSDQARELAARLLHAADCQDVL